MSTSDNPLAPRPGLSIAQRMLATGAAPDLIVQAIDEGLFEGVDLNVMSDGVPLSEAWARSTELFNLDNYATKLGTVPNLSWPVDKDPSQVELTDNVGKGWIDEAAESIWTEHAGIRLVGAGLDPLQPWANNEARGLSHYHNLLDWASKTGRPWLLRACLASLASQDLEWERERTVHALDSRREQTLGTRLHEAMRHSLPLVAEVWREYGADLNARNSIGETPVFLARSCQALEWALEHGASLADVSNEGLCPKDTWRAQAINEEEWMAMQKSANLSRGEVLALLGKTISNADFEGLKQSFDALDDTSLAVFSGGHTLIGHAAHELLLGNTTPSSRDRWRKSMNKILHFLWSRVDLEGAHANRKNPFLTDRDMAWTASMVAGGMAERAAKTAQKKHGFPSPSLENVLGWGQHVFSNMNVPSYSHPWARLRMWAIRTATRRASDEAMDEVQVARLIQVLNDTAETGSLSFTEAFDTALLIVPSIVRHRDGGTQMAQETKNRLLAELIKTTCRTISGDEYTSSGLGSSEAHSISSFRRTVQMMKADSRLNDDRDNALASCITGLLDMGAVLPKGERKSLARSMDETQMTEHPVFREIEPLLVLLREREMEERIPKPEAPQPAIRKVRF